MRDLLRPDGVIHCATDIADYAEQMLEVLTADEALENTADGFAPRPDHRPVTKFERRGITAGRQIFDLVFRKRLSSGGLHRTSPAAAGDGGEALEVVVQVQHFSGLSGGR
ncbi:hypothetical protein GCM10029992_01330 [Glycomyces albus]